MVGVEGWEASLEQCLLSMSGVRSQCTRQLSSQWPQCPAMPPQHRHSCRPLLSPSLGKPHGVWLTVSHLRGRPSPRVSQRTRHLCLQPHNLPLSNHLQGAGLCLPDTVSHAASSWMSHLTRITTAASICPGDKATFRVLADVFCETAR